MFVLVGGDEAKHLARAIGVGLDAAELVGPEEPPFGRTATNRIGLERAVLDALEANGVRILNDRNIVDERLARVEEAEQKLAPVRRIVGAGGFGAEGAVGDRLPGGAADSSLAAHVSATRRSARGSRRSKVEPPPSAADGQRPLSKYGTSSIRHRRHRAGGRGRRHSPACRQTGRDRPPETRRRPAGCRRGWCTPRRR